MTQKILDMFILINLIFAGIVFISYFNSEHLIISATAIIVDDDGDGDYTTIQEAINNAYPGDIIYIWSGIYNETILVNKSLSLIGNGTSNTIITHTITLTANFINITGLTLTKCGSGSTKRGLNLQSAQNCNISNNNFSDLDCKGIYLESSSNNIFFNNIFSNFEYGMGLYHSSNNTFIENTFFDMHFRGFRFEHSQENKLIYNKFSNVFSSEINFYNSNENIINNNNFSKNMKIGLHSSNFNIVDKNIFMNDSYIEITYSHSNIICNNTCLENSGVSLVDSYSNLLENNLCIDGFGIPLKNSFSNLILNNNCSSNKDTGIILWDESNNNSIMRNICNSNYNNGIYILNSKDNEISFNVCNSNNYGILIENTTLKESSTNNTIFDNICNLNTFDGIKIVNSDYNNVSNNICEQNNDSGISLFMSSFNTIIRNFCNLNNYNGIYINKVGSNILINNICYFSKNGILISNSSNNKLNYNKLEFCGIIVHGKLFSHWATQIIDISNTVNNKPIYYWKNKSNDTIPVNAGEIILVNCKNISIENQNLSNSSIGIILGFTNNINILNNTCSNNNIDGIYLYASSNNIIENNLCSFNCRYGLYLNYLSNNNKILNNRYLNNINCGICCKNSDNNLIYHNHFKNNTGKRAQGYDTGNNNLWNLSYPNGGNYWNDYKGKDNKSGPNQDQMGSDGLGDVPYTLDGRTIRDYFPIMPPTIPLPPQNLTAISYNEYIQLNWRTPYFDGGNEIIEYRIYKSEEPRNETYLNSVTYEYLYYIDSNVINETKYYYYITALNKIGESLPSNIINITIKSIYFNDSDADGMPNEWEIKYGLNITNKTDADMDPDNDLLTNLEEYLNKTNPLNPDTDGDNYIDGVEIDKNTDPLDDNDHPPKVNKNNNYQINYIVIYTSIFGIIIILILVIIFKKYYKNKTQ